MKVLVTGAAGFIGSQLVDRLLKDGFSVVGVDNLSTGRSRFLEEAHRYSTFQFFKRDLLEVDALNDILADVKQVFHLAANADVRYGLKSPRKDLEQNTLVTWHVLEAMRKSGARNIAFTSSGSVYGRAEIIPTPEHAPFPLQTSLYGASKLAAESFLSAYAFGYGFQVRIFRLVSVLGPRYGHGHVFDFIQKLQKDPHTIEVLGNGKQRKSYIYISDCIDALLHGVMLYSPNPVEIYNVGTQESCTVDDSLDTLCDMLRINPNRIYTGGEEGWIGDNPIIELDCSRLRSSGWQPTLAIRDGIRKTADYLLSNPWMWKAV